MLDECAQHQRPPRRRTKYRRSGRAATRSARAALLPVDGELERVSRRAPRSGVRARASSRPQRVVLAARVQALDRELGDALLAAVAEGLAHDDEARVRRHRQPVAGLLLGARRGSRRSRRARSASARSRAARCRAITPACTEEPLVPRLNQLTVPRGQVIAVRRSAGRLDAVLVVVVGVVVEQVPPWSRRRGGRRPGTPGRRSRPRTRAPPAGTPPRSGSRARGSARRRRAPAASRGGRPPSGCRRTRPRPSRPASTASGSRRSSLGAGSLSRPRASRCSRAPRARRAARRGGRPGSRSRRPWPSRRCRSGA